MTRMRRRSRLRAAFAVAAAVTACSAAAEVKLENAWLRPAYAGQPAAMVYVDIASSQPLTLVAAKSPAAKRAELVLVDPPGAPPEQHKVVKVLPVPAAKVTRLAYLGTHVRLVDIQNDLRPGDSVALELSFVSTHGTRSSVTTSATVRGIAPRPPESTKATK